MKLTMKMRIEGDNRYMTYENEWERVRGERF